MNFYVGIAVGVVIGILIGAYLMRSFNEGFQPTAESAEGSAPNSFINEMNLPIACSTINTLSTNFINRIKSKPEYTSSDAATREALQTIIDNHLISVKTQKEALKCPS